jgi:Right handed beta helix region
MKRRQLSCSRIGTALLFCADFARSRFSRESSGRRRKWVTLVAVGLLGALAGAQAATINVTNLGDSGAGSLRQAILDAASGDLVLVNLAGTINLTSGSLVVNKDLLIEGPGARTLTIARSGSTKFRIIHVTSGSVYLAYVTITNGDASSGAQGGGGVLVDLGASLTVDYSALTNNTAGSLPGGAILNNGGSVTVRFDTISGNQAGVGGGIENNGQAGPAVAYLLESTIANNATSTASAVNGGGGGIDNDHGTLTLDSCTIAGNSGDTGNSTAGGGGVQNVSGSSATVINTLMASNTTNQLGADVNGAFTSNGFNLIRISNGSTGFTAATDQTGTAASPLNAFLGPLQNNGGHTDTRAPAAVSPAIDKGRTSFHIDQRLRQAPYDNPSIPNATGGDGTDIGAVELVTSQNFFVEHTNDFGNGSLREAIIRAGPGDAVIFRPSVSGTINLTSGLLTIDRAMTITGPGARKVTVAGAGFYISGGGAVVISGLTIGNSVSTGVNDHGNVIMTDCAIVNNQGGGFFVDQSSFLILTRCTISGNTTYQGAGIYNDGTAMLTNCTIANNTATDANLGGGRAGGIFNNSISTLYLTNCTVSGNAAVGNPSGGDGGGLELNGTVHLANTIVAGNTTDGTGPDIFGAGVSDGYNLIRIRNGSTGFTDGVNHDIVGTASNPIDANLGALRNNGGQTNTQALGPGSRAINAANNAVAPATDQRNYIRPDTADIGAFEYNATIPVTLANISTRAFVGTGDNVLIAGFIITGTDAKKVILRAIGPSLNLPGKINDPTLELHASDGHSLVINDNWRDAANVQEIIDSGIPPANDLESAILITLNPGTYTAIMGGANNTTGVGVVEAYDLDRTGNSILANISTRAAVQTGENVLIGGFIVLGNTSQQVLARAIGPSLGIPGALADPTLELHDVNGALIASNDNWRTDQEAQIIATTIPPTNDLESAIVRNLFPGNYTAIVSGVNGATGIAVVEAYGLN